MAIQPVPPLTDIPPFPALSDRADGTYNSKAFAFATHMADNFNAEIGAVANNILGNATWAQAKAAEAEAAVETARASAEVALAAASAQPWVSGTSYAKNALVISQVDFQPYRRMVAGAGTTDPANDTGAVWMPLFGNGAFTPRAAATATFDLSTGNFFTRTMSASETWVFDKCPANGFGFTVELRYTGGVLTLPSTVKTANNLVYSFTAGKTYELMFRTTNKGATRWRVSVTEPYDN